MATGKGGYSCIYRGCRTKSGGGLSLFSIPKNEERAEHWLRAANRIDLFEKGFATLHKHFKLCELHFEKKCISYGMDRKSLFLNAVPTIFHHLKRRLDGHISSDEHSHQGLIDESASSEVIEKFGIKDAEPAMNVEHEMESSSQHVQIQLQSISGDKPLPNDISTTYIQQPCVLLPSSASTQTSSILSSHTPRKIKLYKKIRSLRLKLNKGTTTQSRKEKYSVSEFNKMCDKFLNKPLSQVLKAQVILGSKTPKTRRYSKEYKQFALTLYFLGPRAYSFMGKLLYLPSKRSLQRMTENLACKPGLNNEQIFDALKIKVSTMIEQDKHCTICIDEMSLKSNLYFDLGRDEIVGLCDIGSEKKSGLVAENVLVIMARGLYSNWKQPLAYFFVNTSFEAEKLCPVIKKCILKLFKCGLYVDCLVTDMGSNFMKLGKLLGVRPGNAEFTVDDKLLFYIYDPCHLIKATRNSLINNILCFDGYKKTSWTYVEAFYREDKGNQYRCAPKLTSSHIYPTNFEKMRVKLATQVLSHTVASSMSTFMALGHLPADALGTIEFIQKFDILFDILNSFDTGNSNKYKNCYEGSAIQLNYLNSMSKFIQELKIFDKSGKNVTSRSRSLKCWVITIDGVKKLWDRLLHFDFKYLKTRRLNQDCLENYFGSIRQQGGNSINPTPIQFQRAFKKLFCQNFLHSNAMNCKDDLDKQLMDLKPSNIICTGQQEENNPVRAIALPDSDYKYQNITNQNAFQYVCGYLLKKCINVHNCEVCIEYCRKVVELDLTHLLTHFKAFNTDQYVYGGLSTPSENFVQYIYKLEQIFSTSYETILTEKQVSYSYFNVMKDVTFIHPCKLFPITYLVKLFIRLRLYYSLKYFNRDLKSKNWKKNVKKGNRKLSILTHL